MYKYETHCHTSPVSKCGKASPAETIAFYKQAGYDGVFITNHFLDGNIALEVRTLPYLDQVDFYYSDYDECVRLGAEMGIKVFPGVELSYKGTDFLIYGLDRDWYRRHPEIMGMSKTEELAFMMDEGGFVIQAHPYREAHYIDHIRLFPRSVHGAEVINSNQAWLSNEMADHYADRYGLLKTAGSDNHWGGGIFAWLKDKGFRPEVAGMCSDTPINSVQDYIDLIRARAMKAFLMDESGQLRLVQE